MNQLVRPTIVTAAGLLLASSIANADCMMNRDGDVMCGRGECQRDRFGAVLCSAFRNGSALRMSNGRIICGKGQCAKTVAGEVFCSIVVEGSVLKDMHGVIHCEGQCERASVDYCEATPAGTAPK